MQTSTFDSILDAIETLSLDEQTALIGIIHRRISDTPNGTLRERRRSEIAANIAQGKEDYKKGKVFGGTVDQAIAALNS